MKKLCLTVFLLFFGLLAIAQNISVKSFKALSMDMTASSLEGKRIDQNGQVAALIKVMTTETGFVFEGGTLGIVDTQQRVGEIWVWVPRASRKITILHQQLGGLRDYRYPIEIESERTYEMVLDITKKPAPDPKDQVRQQYLAFQISPADAELEVEGEIWPVSSRGTARRRVKEGEYHYKVTALGCKDEESMVSVADSAVTVSVTLKPISKEPTKNRPTAETKQPKTERPIPQKTDNDLFFVMANAAYSLAPQTSFGLTVGSVKRWGWYASVGTNFKYVRTGYDCVADGTISNNPNNYYHFTEKETMRLSIVAGAVVRIAKPVYAYFGAGYGVRNLLWHFEGDYIDGVAKNTAYSHEGVALDAGMMIHIGHFSGSLGVQTVNFGYVEAKLGLGMNF